MGVDGGYRLGGGSAVPPLLLDDDEAVAIVVGLKSAAGNAVAGVEEASVRALTKLHQVLPARLRARFAGLSAATAASPWSEPTVDPDVLIAVARAMGSDEGLRFVYRAPDGTESRRSIEPKGLVVVGRRWYVLGWDDDRDDWRTFRADRMWGLWSVARGGSRHELPAGHDPASFVREGQLAMAPTYGLVATIHAPFKHVARRLGDAGNLERLGPDRCRLTIGGDTLDWLLFRLLALDADFEIEDPPELVERVRRLAKRLARTAAAASAPG